MRREVAGNSPPLSHRACVPVIGDGGVLWSQREHARTRKRANLFSPLLPEIIALPIANRNAVKECELDTPLGGCSTGASSKEAAIEVARKAGGGRCAES